MGTTPSTTFSTNLDRRIYQTIAGCDVGNPQSLMGILAGVDGCERLVLTHEELTGGLLRLVAAGLVASIEGQGFLAAGKADASSSFTGVTVAEYDAAVADYHTWFQEQMARSEARDDADGDAFVRRMIVLRWALPDGRWPTDADEDAAEKLAEKASKVLSASNLGEVIGFEHGSGHIDVLVFGREGDDDVEAAYARVAEVFARHGCPRGSRIIRVYDESGEEVESDIVA